MNIHQGLLFLQGHILRPEDFGERAPGEPSPHRSRPGDCFSLFETLLLLGGRPMHPDRPFDRDEPLELLQEPCAGH